MLCEPTGLNSSKKFFVKLPLIVYHKFKLGCALSQNHLSYKIYSCFESNKPQSLRHLKVCGLLLIAKLL